ncbi:MAG: CPBP family intramembrane metalloprotease [Actinomycetota bacterium]|nr:CPBP family intramembrane metalloprotease [Actinomycetota bacterium]
MVLVENDDLGAAKARLEGAQGAVLDESVEEPVFDRPHPAQTDETREEMASLPPCPWGARDLAAGVLVAALALAAFVFFLWRDWVVGDLSPLALDLAWFGVLAVAVLGPIWFFTVHRKGSREDVFLRAVSPVVVLFTVPGAFLFTVVDRIVWGLVSVLIEVPTSSAYWWGREAPPEGLDVLGLALTTVILAPAIEEVLYRGILLRYFGSFLRPSIAVSLTALLFAILHLQPAGIPSRFVFGIAAATLVYATRSLFPALAFHMTLNTMSLLAFTGVQS